MTADQTDPVQISALEQKFLRRLLECAHYRAPLSEIYPNAHTSLTQRRAAARHLQTRGLVEYNEEIVQVAITPKGRIVFDLGMMARPVTPDELLVLKSCQYNKVTPGQISRKVPEAAKRSLIDALEQRRFVKTKRQISEVWLTQQGLAVLMPESPSSALE